MDRFDRAGAAFAELCRIMARLRAPDGCAWDRKQTLQSLTAYLVEETYETLDAIAEGDPKKHVEELGDLLLQVVFQAEITQAEGSFDIAQVVDGIREKLVRRHPHVFGNLSAADADAALASWEAMKAKERPPDQSLLATIPRSMPALLRAARTSEKAATVGFDWNRPEEARAKVEEEWRELTEATDEKQGDERVREELGDLLFAIVNVSRRLKIDPEEALQRATDKFGRRFRHIETRLRAEGRDAKKASLDELNVLWEEAKSRERSAS